MKKKSMSYVKQYIQFDCVNKQLHVTLTVMYSANYPVNLAQYHVL